MTGRVVDAAGRPVKGARAFIGDDSLTRSPDRDDERAGRVHPGELHRRPEDHHGPGRRVRTPDPDVRVEERTAPVEIQLTEPGSVLRGKVVDIEGKPVAGRSSAPIRGAGAGRIHFRVETDKDGRFEWKNAPKDVVLYDTGKFGYMSSRHVPLTAADREQIITLYPELVITGRVTDAETGRPLPRFRLIRGQRTNGAR